MAISIDEYGSLKASEVASEVDNRVKKEKKNSTYPSIEYLAMSSPIGQVVGKNKKDILTVLI